MVAWYKVEPFVPLAQGGLKKPGRLGPIALNEHNCDLAKGQPSTQWWQYPLRTMNLAGTTTSIPWQGFAKGI